LQYLNFIELTFLFVSHFNWFIVGVSETPK
jgi:hypothetical protein